MKKLKLSKIKLSEMSLEEQSHIYGGYDGTTITVTATVAIVETMHTFPGCFSDGCLTRTPGHQDSCGLCTTNYACESLQCGSDVCGSDACGSDVCMTNQGCC